MRLLLLEYRAAVTAVMDRSGLKAALKIADQLEDERLDLREQIEAIQCTTIEGIRMRARIVFDMRPAGTANLTMTLTRVRPSMVG
jgi:predicted GNAT family acetyltransferase